MTQGAVEEYIGQFAGVWKDYPFGEGTAVYKIGHKEDNKGKLFLLIDEDAKPLKISMKCDPQLALVLRDKYETVQPGYHLNKLHWNTILCTGQVPDDELFDLIRHSYELVSA